MKEIQYDAASTKSQMKGKVLHRRENALSFHSVDKDQVVVVPDIRLDDVVERFDSDENRNRGPLAVFPLRTDTHSIGVLTVDACRRAASLLPQQMSNTQVIELLRKCRLDRLIPLFQETKITGAILMALTDREMQYDYNIIRSPDRNDLLNIISALKRGSNIHLIHVPPMFIEDPITMEFLETVATMAGEMISEHRTTQWLKRISDATKNKQCSVNNVYNMAIAAILDCLVRIKTCAVWRTENKEELYALASCDLPSDRKAPFVQWNERNIRKILLFKEDDDCNGAVLRGNIQRIIAPSDDQMQSAAFRVQWNNTMTQTFSWKDLKQQLAMRPLNPSHHQLRETLETLQTNASFSLDNPKYYVTVFEDAARPLRFAYVICTNFSDDYRNMIEAETFIDGICEKIEPQIKCIRGRLERDLMRRRSLQRVAKMCHSMAITPSDRAIEVMEDIIRMVGNEIVDCVPGCEIALSELQPGGKMLQYTFAFNGCTLKGQELPKELGKVSFECLQTNTVFVIDPEDTSKSQIKRLHRFYRSDELAWPYIFVPIKQDDAQVGVLTVNNFDQAAKGRDDERHPEYGVVDFLMSMAKLAAGAIRSKRRSDALYQLGMITKDPFCAPKHIFFHSTRTVKDTIISARRVRILELELREKSSRVLFEFFDNRRDEIDADELKYIEAIKYRRNELLPETIRHHFNLSYQKADKLQHIVTNRIVDLCEDGTGFQHPDKASYDVLDKTKHRFAVRGVLKRTLATEDFIYSVIPFLSSAKRTVVIAATVDHDLLFQTDQKYMEMIANTTSQLCECVAGRLKRTSFRVSMLYKFRSRCENLTEEAFNTIDSFEHELDIEVGQSLQTYAIYLIEKCFPGCSVYISMFQPYSDSLRYTCASSTSNMEGKRLRRGKGVSFSCLERGTYIVVQNANDDCEYGQLRHFDDPSKMKWPLIVTPCERIGTISMDNFESQRKGRPDETHPELGVADFVSRLGYHMGTTIEGVRHLTLQRRKNLRKKAAENIIALCVPSKDADVVRNVLGYDDEFIRHKILEEVTHAFIGSDAYIGVVQPLEPVIKFVACSEHSIMYHKSIRGQNTMSYTTFSSQETTVIDCIEDSRKLRLFQLGQSGVCVCVPIPFLGVLTVDGFPGVASGVFSDTCPEEGVVDTLETIAAVYGNFVVLQQRKKALKDLQSVVRGNMTTNFTYFETTFFILGSVIRSASDIQLWEVHKTANVLSKYQSAGHELKASEIQVELDEAVALELFNALGCSYDVIQLDALENWIFIPLNDSSLDPNISIHTIAIQRYNTTDIGADVNYMKSVKPIVNHTLELLREKERSANDRIEALKLLKEKFKELEDMPPQIAYPNLSTSLSFACEILAKSLGPSCDVYIAELQPGSECVKYMYHSSQCRVQDYTIYDDRPSLTFDSLRRKEAIIRNQIGTNSKGIRFLTHKKPTGAVVFTPLHLGSDAFGVVVVDSFGRSAFNSKGNLELEVIQYIKTCSDILCNQMATIRYDYSIDLMTKLKRSPHASIQDVYIALLDCIKRDILNVYAQQIIELAPDFTGDYQVLCWYRHRTRWPIPQVQHHCYINDCPIQNRKNEIHYDNLKLPMTNLPRTLDDSRSRGKPLYQIENRGRVPCFAGTLDSKLSQSRIALCVYGRANVIFPEKDVEHLKKLFSAARLAYNMVFRMAIARSFAYQAMHILKERLGGKDSCVVTCLTNQKLTSHRSPGVTRTTNEEGFPLGHVKSKSWKRIMAFLASGEYIKVEEVTTSDEKRTHNAYRKQYERYEKSMRDYQAALKKSKGFMQRKAKAEAQAPPPRKPAAPIPRTLLLYVRVECKKDPKVAEVIIITLHISPVEENEPRIREEYLHQAQIAHTMIKSEFMTFLTYNPRDVDTRTLVIVNLYKKVSNEFSSHCDAIEAEVEESKDEEGNSLETRLVQAATLFLGYKKSFIDSFSAMCEKFTKDQLAHRLHQLNKFDPSSWAAILRGKTYSIGKLNILSAKHMLSEPMQQLLEMEVMTIALVRHLKYLSDKAAVRSKVYLDSAIRIKGFMRSNYLRRLYLKIQEQRKAAITIQTRFRQRLARKTLYFVRRNRAATKIQRAFRRKYRPEKKKVVTKLMGELRIRKETIAATRVPVGAGWNKNGNILETFESFLKSKAGKDDYQSEMRRLTQQMKELDKQRSKLTPLDRTTQHIIDVFELLDDRMSGNITVQQCREILLKLRIPLIDEELNDAIQMIDFDKSGDISRTEFTNWYRYEFESLYKRSKDCGTLSRKGKQWFIQTQARRLVQARWENWKQMTA